MDSIFVSLRCAVPQDWEKYSRTFSWADGDFCKASRSDEHSVGSKSVYTIGTSKESQGGKRCSREYIYIYIYTSQIGNISSQ